jgi:hypothetical protein
MRQKLITLCPNSFELSLKKENFSEWVRKKLLEEVDLPAEEYLFKCKACNLQRVYPTKAVRNCSCGWKLTLVPSIQLQLPGDGPE